MEAGRLERARSEVRPGGGGEDTRGLVTSLFNARFWAGRGGRSYGGIRASQAGIRTNQVRIRKKARPAEPKKNQASMRSTRRRSGETVSISDKP